MTIAWNKGLTKEDPRVKKYADKLINREFSQEWKDRISLAHQGKQLTDSHKKKISESLLGRKRTNQERFNISLGLKGRKFSNETKEKMRLAKIGKHHTQKHRERILKSWTKDKRIEASIRRSKQKLPLKDTKLEMLVQQILIENNIKFHKHHPINLDFMIHQVDILVKPNKVIEVYGTYHHADPRFYNDDHILKVRGHSTAKQIWDHDSKIIESLWDKNFYVLIIWQDDLTKHFSQTKALILDFVK